MIAGANAENLLLVIETQRRGEGVIDGVRKELAGLGLDAKASSIAMGAGAQAGIVEIEKLARTIDVTSKQNVAAFKHSTQMVRELAQAAGLAPAEVQKLSVAEEVLAARLKATNQEARAQAAHVLGMGSAAERMSPKVRTAANALTSVSFAASGMTHNLQGAVVAGGTMVASLASLSSSAAIAASASGIGAIAVVLGTVISLMRSANAEAADLSGTMDVIRSVSGSAEALAVSRNIDQQLATAREKLAAFKKEKPFAIFAPERKELEAEIKGLETAAATAFKSYADMLGAAGQRAGEEWTQRTKSEAERRAREAEQRLKQDAETAMSTQRRLSVAVLDLEQARDNDIYTQRRLKIERVYGEEIEKLNELQISDKRRLELQQQAYQVRLRSLEAAAEENRLLNESHARETRMIAAGLGGDVRQTFALRMEEIEAQKEAEIKSGITRENAEARAQQRIRALQKDTLRGTLGDLKSIEEATISSKNRQIKAIGQAASVFRRLIIGAEAADAAVKSAKAFGEVPKYLAAHQYGSAALSAAAGVQLAAAAALGFREALGGGTGAAGGGGGAGGGANADDRNTFEPRTAGAGAGALHLTLITRNPYGRDEIQNVAYELNRAGVLKRGPIEIPPTTGITRVA